MTITSLVDDYCPKRGLHGEHGLSLYIEMAATRLIFDAGQGATFIDNARALGIDLNKVDAVVLSHGHYDHGGGMKALFEILKDDPPPLFAGRGFDAPRIAKEGDSRKDIGLPRPFLPEHLPSPVILMQTTEDLARGLLRPSMADVKLGVRQSGDDADDRGAPGDPRRGMFGHTRR